MFDGYIFTPGSLADVEVDGDATVLTWPVGAAARHHKVLASEN